MIRAATVELRIWRLMVTATVVAALYFLRDLILPLAVAALAAFVLSPVVSRLERHVGCVAAVLLTTATAFLLIGAFAWSSAVQVGRLAQQLPAYKSNLAEKLQGINASGSQRFARLTGMFEELQQETFQPPDATSAGSASPAASVPIPVEVVETRSQNSERLMDTAGALLRPLGFIGAVLILAIFMLVKRDDLRDRIIGLVGRGELATTTAAMGDAASRVYRYLFMALLVNGGYGIAVGIGLYLIGVPGAALWASLAIVLRFIPYLGPLIAMAFPILLSLAIFDGWTGPLLTVGLFLALEVISNNVVEPWLFGASTGVSSFALIVAALAWTWLWGPVGLLLSTPLTVCLLVMGKHVPQLAIMRTVLSDESALEPHEVLYQRALSGDRVATQKAMRDASGRQSIEERFDATLLPALAMAQADLHRGALDAGRHASVVALMRDSIEQMVPSPGDAAPASGPTGTAREATLPARSVRVACVAVDGAADDAAAELFLHVARKRGFEAVMVPQDLAMDGLVATLDREQPDIAWLCMVDPESLSRCRTLCALLHDRMPALPVYVGQWRSPAHEAAGRTLASLGATVVSMDFGESVMHLEAFRDTFSDDYMSAPIPDDEAARIAALMDSGLGAESRNELFDRTTAELTRVFGVPIALVTVVDADWQHFISHQGLDAELQAARCTSRDVSVCGHVVAANRPLVIEDLARDPRFAGNPLLRGKGLRFYAGVPLRTRGGFPVGSLCILDHVPRKISGTEVRLMEVIGETLMSDIEAQASAAPAR